MLKPKYALIALLSGLALVATACSSSGGGTSQSPGASGAGSTSGSASTSGSTSSAPSSSTAPAVPKKPVHIKTLNSDGATYGVGMPVIAFFSRKITDARPLQKATTVTVNGQKADGEWFFETSAANKGYPIEGHLRLENYWPAHSRVHVGIAAKGLPAGGNMAFDNSLTLDFSIGPRIIATVDDSSHMMTVTTDGQKYGEFPVSLGAENTPTATGIKVIMEQGATVRMRGPGYDECCVKFTQRLTYGGEYLHSAPWNLGNIGRADSSNGCTNLRPADAQKLFHYMHVGDVVIYPNANGPAMTLGAGYGDWNVDWGVWQTGGLAPTR